MRSYHPNLARAATLLLVVSGVALSTVPASAGQRTENQTVCAFQNYKAKNYVLDFKIAREFEGRKQVLVDRLERTGRFTTKRRPTWRAWIDCGRAR